MGDTDSQLVEKEPKESHVEEQQVEEKNDYPSFKVVLPAMASLYLAFFLISLDRTILGTAIPAITDEFHSFDDISWYESGFLLPLCVLQLSFGRVYTFYAPKWILIALVAIFEVGSIVCATAPNSTAVIVGRVICGIGGAGTTSGALNLIASLVPLQSRPKYIGGIGAVFGVSSAIGPLLGGYLTAVSWRWCFWINVPIGGVSLVVLTFLCPKGTPPAQPAQTWQGKIKQLDPLGFVLIAPTVVCLLFALRLGGVQYPWDDGLIIALFVLSGAFGGAFIGVQVWRGDKATIPPKVFARRSMLAASGATLGTGALLVVYALYLPVWFQAIQGKTPQSSGLSILPLLLSNVLFVILGGIATSVGGYYTPLMIIGSAIAIVGAALITTWQVDSGPGQWIGYQVVTGTGLGLVLQQPTIAAQTVLPKDQVPIGITVIAFFQFFSGTIFTSVCQTLLENHLADAIAGKVKGLNVASLANAGATTLTNKVPPNKLSFVLNAYNNSLRSIWYLALGLASVIFLSSLFLEWKSVKKAKKSEKDESNEKGLAEEGTSHTESGDKSVV